MTKQKFISAIQTNFVEFDDIRLFINNWAKEHKWKTTYTGDMKGKKGAYEKSSFYIGRNRVRFSFYGLRCDYVELTHLRFELIGRYTEYLITQNSDSDCLVFYLKPEHN